MASSRVARDRPRQIASRLSGPAWRKSSKYLALALGEVSLTKVNLPRAMLLARRPLGKEDSGTARALAKGRACDSPASVAGK